MKKIIHVPLIEAIEKMSGDDFNAALDASCQPNAIDSINWPDAFPYAPACSFRIARSHTHLAVSFETEGLDIRASYLEDNGNSWEDSCVEIFLSPGGNEYYNVEITCIGSILMACGSGREGRRVLPLSDVARITRRSSLEHKKYDLVGGPYKWRVCALIPFDLLGLDGSALPHSVEANFYKCGNLTAHKHFVSWNPIETEKPDFHRPEFFGMLEF